MKNPYKYVHINGKNYVEHRIVVENGIGRKLAADEVVHHINGDYRDNRIENLLIMTNSEHSKLHSENKVAELETIKCAYCGTNVTKRKASLNYQRKKGIELFYCNRVCAGKHKYALGIKPPTLETDSNMDSVILEGIKNGLNGCTIAKMNGWNKQTVYTHIKKLSF